MSVTGMRVLLQDSQKIGPKSDAIRDLTQPSEGLRLRGSSRAVAGDHLAALRNTCKDV